jgi:iron complex outermembrane recepter protein
MYYSNQLVLTGELSDTGSPLRTNAERSYRRGVEAEWAWNFYKNFLWAGNITLSQNKIERFKEVIYDYTNGFDIIEIEHTNTDISFSPNVIAANQLIWKAVDKEKTQVETAVMSKYVGRQFLDNTSDTGRMLDAYLTHDLRLTVDFRMNRMKTLQVNLLVNNFTNKLFSANGYTYSYVFESMITENFFYPQAGTHYLLAVTMKF